MHTWVEAAFVEKARVASRHSIAWRWRTRTERMLRGEFQQGCSIEISRCSFGRGQSACQMYCGYLSSRYLTSPHSNCQPLNEHIFCATSYAVTCTPLTFHIRAELLRRGYVNFNTVGKFMAENIIRMQTSDQQHNAMIIPITHRAFIQLRKPPSAPPKNAILFSSDGRVKETVVQKSDLRPQINDERSKSSGFFYTG